ncbi:hypothetical protein [Bacillus sp. JCM 19041]|uniref:hypothetical protein n=1 Tax=Bacillus sp. JCM 19041 TaxID=1460637 RepID=UPI00336A371E
MAESFFVDKAFISSDGVAPGIGMTCYRSEKCSLSQVLISHANQSYALLDHSKLGVKANYKMAAMGAFSHVICDAEVPGEWELDEGVWVKC